MYTSAKASQRLEIRGQFSAHMESRGGRRFVRVVSWEWWRSGSSLRLLQPHHRQQREIKAISGTSLPCYTRVVVLLFPPRQRHWRMAAVPSASTLPDVDLDEVSSLVDHLQEHVKSLRAGDAKSRQRAAETATKLRSALETPAEWLVRSTWAEVSSRIAVSSVTHRDSQF